MHRVKIIILFSQTVSNLDVAADNLSAEDSGALPEVKREGEGEKEEGEERRHDVERKLRDFEAES